MSLIDGNGLSAADVAAVTGNNGNGSYDRGRSPVTGRYVSRDHGYSGHSINDRMISQLENMYDEAKTEYEREEVRKEIERLRGKSN